jgi:hypothetical protein
VALGHLATWRLVTWQRGAWSLGNVALGHLATWQRCYTELDPCLGEEGGA